MGTRAPEPSATTRNDDLLASVLAAVEAAPLVGLSEHERELLSHGETLPVEWLSHEAFLSQVQPLDDAE